MLSYYFKCTKNTESKNPKVTKKKNAFVDICVACNSKKSRFIKKQVANRLLSNLVKKTL